MPAIPPALHAWYRSSYPTLQFNPEWLEACVEYLQESDPAASTTPGLIKAVEVQLLSSDLSTSVCLPTPPARRAALTTRTPASAHTILFAGVRKGAVLFQVQRVSDAAHSAIQGREVFEDKREVRKLAGREGDGRIMSLDEEEQSDADNKDAVLPAAKAPVFPRGNGSFLLTDGETEVKAFERERIDGLGLEDIKLGTKLLVHDVPFVNGILMLTRDNTVVKGYQVEELEENKEWYLENDFRERVGMDPLPPPGVDLPPAVAAAGAGPAQDADMVPPARSPRPRRRSPPVARPGPPPKQQSPSSDYFGDDDDLLMAAADDDEEEALRAMEEEAMGAARAAPPTRRGAASAQRVKPEPRSSGSRTAPAGAGGTTGLSGQVEVLELDSDDDEEPVVKREAGGAGASGRARPGPAPAKGGGAGARGRTTVLEIDSDD
ncbi:uncharacterized protein RHOBADRAFT_54443 [Rhodotorula graminis WP1]|uniref:RecQ-mediated genome instability protein 1 n=1 Tax=Rhodotorula graminis (strain WP1) TaxID=578459 RepID=A0A0P9FDM2_RHOGW|nr:uncharacterized protein RHOBADRAFT_54443 [Rhodotorula graminis WP1]KPV73849.1 hypothetical protein RHOBADRAFT_54443 [Rhodotorula graminis WP1]